MRLCSEGSWRHMHSPVTNISEDCRDACRIFASLGKSSCSCASNSQCTAAALPLLLPQSPCGLRPVLLSSQYAPFFAKQSLLLCSYCVSIHFWCGGHKNWTVSFGPSLPLNIFGLTYSFWVHHCFLRSLPPTVQSLPPIISPSCFVSY